MVFAPKRRGMIVSSTFLPLTIGNHYINYVQQFKYLGHIVTDGLTDDEDINREIKNTFAHTNVLLWFRMCSVEVKVVIFKAFCLCLYDIGLWKKSL